MKIQNNTQVFNVEVQELLAKTFIRSFCQQIFTEQLLCSRHYGVFTCI